MGDAMRGERGGRGEPGDCETTGGREGVDGLCVDMRVDTCLDMYMDGAASGQDPSNKPHINMATNMSVHISIHMATHMSAPQRQRATRFDRGL